MDKITLYSLINSALLILIYILYLEKNKISNKLTKILIKEKIVENEMDINTNDRLNSIKLINKKYGVGVKNAKIIFDSLNK